MSNKKNSKIKENDLVELIDNILNEALVVKNKNGLVNAKKQQTKQLF
jgi:broad-specificity NMP kinase